jgi:hypothetical protein
VRSISTQAGRGGGLRGNGSGKKTRASLVSTGVKPSNNGAGGSIGDRVLTGRVQLVLIN